MSSPSEKLRIVVTGLIAQHPGLSGVAWDYLQYPIGLARLGHDVYYVEDSGEWPYLDRADSSGSWIRKDPSYNLSYLHNTLSRFDLGEKWMYRFPLDGRWYGPASRDRIEILKTADLLINVSGTIEDLSPYLSIPTRAYIDSDPLFTQLKLLSGQEDASFNQRFAMHNIAFSFGERIMMTNLAGNYQWIPTRQPILLDQWRNDQPLGKAFSTVLSWTSYPPITWNGKSYGQKDLQLLKILDIPKATHPQGYHIAMNSTIHKNWELQASTGYDTPQELLTARGWIILDARESMSSIDDYRKFIQGSRGEFSVAKHGYVAGNTGWFSCRSACYLASGRPVIVEDTGFSEILPTGLGLLAFRNQDEAVEAIREVNSRPGIHATSASEIAYEYFDSNKVLVGLLDKIYTRNQRVRRENTL